MPYQRKEERRALRIPITVTFQARDEHGVEETHEGAVVDASKGGLKLRVERFFRRDTILFLTLPFSFAFRDYSFSGSVCHAYGIVVYSIKYGPREFEIGVAVAHDNVPPGFKPFAGGSERDLNRAR